MNNQEQRIKILEQRLRLLAEYIDKFEHGANNPTLAQFMKAKGVSHAMFIKDLPVGYRNVPAEGYDAILDYTLQIQELLNSQNPNPEKEQEKVESPAKEGGCKCGGGCGKHADGVNDDDEFNAIGSICIKPIAPIIPEKINPGMWRSYRNKVTAYNKCVADKKAAGGYTLEDKASHALHLSNPSEATGRAAFLRLVEYNIFGLGSTFEKMRQDPNQSHWKDVKKKWYRMGGAEKKLDQNVSIGRNKKPVFKPKGWKPKGGSVSADGVIYGATGEVWYNAEAWTAAGIAGLIVAATGMLATMAPVIKSFKKEKGEAAVDFEGSPDPSREGDVPDGYDPGGTPTEGMSIGLKIGLGVGIATSVALISWGLSKLLK